MLDDSSESGPPGRTSGDGTSDYAWAHSLAVGSLPVMSAEELLRRVWEDGPRLLAVFLPFAWRFGLGLRLGPKRSETHVLGWPIVVSATPEIVVATTSPFMSASNTVAVQDDCVRWSTEITYRNVVGRLLWIPARLIHERLIPFSLKRAVRPS